MLIRGIENAWENKAMSAPIELEPQEVKRLVALMKDPRYWRDRDPEIERILRAGFRRLLGKQSRREPHAQREVGNRPAA